ncbi:MAG: TonB-dependent receptor [Gammaproteobacteria bacterium]
MIHRICRNFGAIFLSTIIAGLQFLSATAYGQSLEEVIVTAERRELNLQQTPISVSAFNQIELDRLGLQTTEDIANFVPNVSVGTAFGSGDMNATFSIRGAGQFRNTTFFDRGVGLYIDDVYYPRNAGAILRILDVERVEVLRGPQGTLFGRNNTGGAIRYISQKPEPEFNADVNLTAGEFGRTDLQGHLNVPLSDTVAFRLTGADFSRDGYLIGQNGQEKGNVDITAVRAQLRFEPTENFDFTIAYAVDDSKDNGQTGINKDVDEFDPTILPDGMSGMGGTEINGQVPTLIYEEPTFGCYWNAGTLDGPCVTPGFNANDPSTYFSDAFAVAPGFYDYVGGDFDARSAENTFTTFEMNWDMTDSVTMTVVGGSIQGERDDVFDDDMTPLPIISQTSRDEWNSESIELRFSGDHDRLSWTAGYYYFQEDASSYQLGTTYDCSPMGMNLDLDSCGPDVGESTELIDSDATGLFGQITYALTDKLGITVGYRSTEDTKGAGALLLNEPAVAAEFGTNPLVISVDGNDALINAGNSWTSDDYRLVLDYQFNDDLFGYASFSTAYKAGGFSDMITDDTDSDYVLVGRDGVAGTGDENLARFGLIPYDPESVEGFEIGVRSEWLDQRLRLNASIFDMQFTDRHIRAQDRFFQNPPFTANASQLDIQGIEIDLMYAITDNLRLTTSIGTLDSEYSGIDPSATGGVFNETPRERMPDISATLGLRHISNLANGGELVLAGNAAFTDEFYNGSSSNHQELIAAYTLLSLRAEYWAPGGNWNVALTCTNCMDDEVVRGATDMAGTRVLPDGSIGGGGAGVGANRWEIGPPRMLAVSYGYHFE